MDAVVPLHNLPNLKQGQNGVEVALEIDGIVLDVKAHLPRLKETVVSSTIVVLAFIVDCQSNFSRKEILAIMLQFIYYF
jgi:hypothetical protein